MEINDENQYKKQNQFEITIADLNDLDEVLTLLRSVARWLKQKGSNQWETILNGEDDQEMRLAVENKQTYIVKEDKHIIATFTIYLKASNWDIMLWGRDDSKSAYLHKLAVIPDKMGKGLGYEIIHWAEQKLRDEGVDRLRLDCVADNNNLNTFYSGNGFEKVGENHGFTLFEKDLT